MNNLTSTTVESKPIAVKEPVSGPGQRLFKVDLLGDHANTPAGLARRVSALEDEVITLSAHLSDVLAHFANGGKVDAVPLAPPAAPEPESTPEIDSVAVALAALTPEQKAALRALLG